ncbi:reverse transcriptase domain-containing protein [Tanacetum coccineum]
MKKFETPPDSPPIIVIDPDDQPMWSNTRTISSLLQYGENQEEAVMLRTFLFSLCEEAKIWLNELNEGTFTSWNEIREAFISRYFSPAKFKRLLNVIRNSHQLDNETLVEAWIRLKEMLCICYGHGLTKGTIVPIFYHGLDGPTQGILDAGGIFLYNTPNKAFQILEDKVILKLDFLGEFRISPNRCFRRRKQHRFLSRHVDGEIRRSRYKNRFRILDHKERAQGDARRS